MSHRSHRSHRSHGYIHGALTTCWTTTRTRSCSGRSWNLAWSTRPVRRQSKRRCHPHSNLHRRLRRLLLLLQRQPRQRWPPRHHPARHPPAGLCLRSVASWPRWATACARVSSARPLRPRRPLPRLRRLVRWCPTRSISFAARAWAMRRRHRPSAPTS